MTLCKNCGANYDERYGVCPRCGMMYVNQPLMPSVPLKKKKSTGSFEEFGTENEFKSSIHFLYSNFIDYDDGIIYWSTTSYNKGDPQNLTLNAYSLESKSVTQYYSVDYELPEYVAGSSQLYIESFKSYKDKLYFNYGWVAGSGVIKQEDYLVWCQ